MHNPVVTVTENSKSLSPGDFMLAAGIGWAILALMAIYYAFHVIGVGKVIDPLTMSMMAAVGVAKTAAPFDFYCGLFSIFSTIGTTLIVCSRSFRAQHILISADLIRFSSPHLLELNGRLERLWSDLQLVIVRPVGASSVGELIMLFKSGGKATINLQKYDGEQLEQLLLAIETRGGEAAKNADLGALIDSVCATEKLLPGGSFTEIWEAGINKNFGAVSFLPLEPGAKLQSGYSILRQLSFGGFAALYLAENGGSKFILKEAVIPPAAEPAARKAAQEMLDQEASLLLKLSHPQIASVRDFVVEGGRSYLVLEYFPGWNLRQLVKKQGSLDESTAVDYAKQIAEVLVYLHSQNPPIVHRDISPENIILDQNGKPVLIDFGAATEFIAAATGTAIGKQSYVPPEQLRGKATPQSDIFGLGATIYFLLTGQDPEPLSDSRPNRSGAAISAELDELVAACTQLEPADRVESAVQLLQSLKGLQAHGRLSLDADLKDKSLFLPEVK